jgi:hypothetical protein
VSNSIFYKAAKGFYKYLLHRNRARRFIPACYRCVIDNFSSYTSTGSSPPYFLSSDSLNCKNFGFASCLLPWVSYFLKYLFPFKVGSGDIAGVAFQSLNDSFCFSRGMVCQISTVFVSRERRHSLIFTPPKWALRPMCVLLTYEQPYSLLMFAVAHCCMGKCWSFRWA